MFDSLKNSGRRVMDPLGKLCFAGQDVANYLFQVPDDASQWEKIEKIVDAIIVEAAKTKRRELPNIAQEMKQALQQPHSMMLAEQLLSGFDPTPTGLRARGDHDRSISNLEIHLFDQTYLVEERLGDADALRVSDSDDPGLHDSTS